MLLFFNATVISFVKGLFKERHLKKTKKYLVFTSTLYLHTEVGLIERTVTFERRAFSGPAALYLVYIVVVLRLMMML